jgi:hypothetical protein
MKKNRAYKKDGKLVVQFTFSKGLSLIEMEEQIESLLASIDESVSEPEKPKHQSSIACSNRKRAA